MIIDPNEVIGVGKGRKVFQGVGFRRWESQNGTPIIDVGLVVLKDLAEDSSNEGLVCTARFFLTQAAGWRFGKFAKACGHVEPFDAFDDDAIDNILSKGPLLGVVELEEYKGNSYARPGGWAPFSGTESADWPELLADGEAKFEAMTEKQNSEHGGGERSSSSTSASSSSKRAPSGDDDIPF